MEILHIENLSFRYPKCESYAVKDINLNICAGEFVVLCGQSGCGKTTLLKLIKRELAPVGEKSGEIKYNGTDIKELYDRASASEIGYVMQNPDSQTVTDKVWHELAFGLENLGLPQEAIRRRVGETASWFGIQGWFRKDTDKLSGGQKQILNLASVVAMEPQLLILDEPTGQLDPIAAADFISTLLRLNRELGITVILAEHRLEEVFPVADRVLVMDGGKIILNGRPENIERGLLSLNENHPMLSGMPGAVRIYNMLQRRLPDIFNPSELKPRGECLLTVRQGRDFLEEHFKGEGQGDVKPERQEEPYAIEMKNVWFRYERDLPDILTGMELRISRGELFFLLGGNGSGKTTVLNVISGLNKPYRGRILIDGKSIKDYRGNALYRRKLAYLPQNPQTVFLKDSVRADFVELFKALEISRADYEPKIEKISEKLGIEGLLDRHPYDLSGGEQQKCALAKILLTEPEILLLDEPTKGMDAHSKLALKAVLKELKTEKMTVAVVSHDVEFAAENADRCALFFDGSVISSDVPEIFFAENSFYTTAANRMARRLWKNAVTCEQVVEKCIEEAGKRRKTVGEDGNKTCEKI